MASVYIAAGSNLEPERNLTRAVNELRREFPSVRFSSWYRNSAVGFEGEDFINFVAGFTTHLPVQEVLARLHAIEPLCGRTRDGLRWAPCSMDLDVLLYDDLTCEQPRLKLPRPDLLKCAYMLGPMAELAPDLVHPTAQLSIHELWQRFDRATHPLQRVGASLTYARPGSADYP